MPLTVQRDSLYYNKIPVHEGLIYKHCQRRRSILMVRDASSAWSTGVLEYWSISVGTPVLQNFRTLMITWSYNKVSVHEGLTDNSPQFGVSGVLEYPEYLR